MGVSRSRGRRVGGKEEEEERGRSSRGAGTEKLGGIDLVVVEFVVVLVVGQDIPMLLLGGLLKEPMMAVAMMMRLASAMTLLQKP